MFFFSFSSKHGYQSFGTLRRYGRRPFRQQYSKEPFWVAQIAPSLPWTKRCPVFFKKLRNDWRCGDTSQFSFAFLFERWLFEKLPMFNLAFLSLLFWIPIYLFINCTYWKLMSSKLVMVSTRLSPQLQPHSSSWPPPHISNELSSIPIERIISMNLTFHKDSFCQWHVSHRQGRISWFSCS